jgi:Polyketide cyclase / dehydrase and lipid transport
MLITIFTIFAVAIAIILILAAMKPDSFALSRSIQINAKPATIFSLIDNVKLMNSWNPFATPDPRMTISYSGPESGIGAKYDWAGGKSGAGQYEILESTASKRVLCRLLMIKPMAADNRVEFTLTPNGESTIVTWSMTGNVSYVAKILHTVMNMDKMVGGTFDKGLAALKAKVEG